MPHGIYSYITSCYLIKYLEHYKSYTFVDTHFTQLAGVVNKYFRLHRIKFV